MIEICQMALVVVTRQHWSAQNSINQRPPQGTIHTDCSCSSSGAIAYSPWAALGGGGHHPCRAAKPGAASADGVCQEERSAALHPRRGHLVEGPVPRGRPSGALLDS